jgi:Ca-activated chloride channel family protein
MIRAMAALALLASPVMAEEAPRTIIVMDGSGSMWGQIDGRTKLEIARETAARVLATIPATQELGLMAYGHREKGNCSDIELIVPPAPGTGAEIAAQVGKMRFLGKTPLSQSVRQAAEALHYGEEAATVVLVTDGLETCDADPCALGRELEAAGLNFTAHVIGFGLSGAEGAQVACLATETGGQYLQATDAGGLADALTATVTAKLPPPQPLPKPEPTPPLPQASLTAPDSAAAGSVVRVAFEGPHEEFDAIRVLDAKGEWLSEAEVNDEPFVDLRLPFALGPHELIYLYKSSDTIARRRITITEAPVSITAPASAAAGSLIEVAWVGPNAPYDYLQLRDGNGNPISEYKTDDTGSGQWRMPWRTGDFTLIYAFANRDVIFSRPITLTEGSVSISAPDMAQAGAEVQITWKGPNAEYDNIQLYRQADDERISYGYVDDSYQMSFTMPEMPGIYEFRYSFRDTEVIHTRRIAVTLDKVEAAVATGLAFVPVSLSVPAAYAGQPTNWSAEPLDPHPDAPEALAMPEAVTDPWKAELYPGRWRIYGETPASVAAAQAFGADITVTAATGQAFEIPRAPMKTMGMGEDAPSQDVIAVTIRAEGYDGPVEWSATPDGGAAEDRIGDTVAGIWSTSMDPGAWAVFGAAQDATFFGKITVAPGQTEHVIPREGMIAVAPAAAEGVAYRCEGPNPCPFSDDQTGLSFNLPVGWFTDLPFFAETAGGVRADKPTMAFLNAAGDRLELNPTQWLAANGPCHDTPAGPLCRWADAASEVILIHQQVAASLRLRPAIPGIKVDVDRAAAEALRAKLLGGN